jgi:hypothetical protein
VPFTAKLPRVPLELWQTIDEALTNLDACMKARPHHGKRVEADAGYLDGLTAALRAIGAAIQTAHLKNDVIDAHSWPTDSQAEAWARSILLMGFDRELTSQKLAEWLGQINGEGERPGGDPVFFELMRSSLSDFATALRTMCGHPSRRTQSALERFRQGQEQVTKSLRDQEQEDARRRHYSNLVNAVRTCIGQDDEPIEVFCRRWARHIFALRTELKTRNLLRHLDNYQSRDHEEQLAVDIFRSETEAEVAALLLEAGAANAGRCASMLRYDLPDYIERCQREEQKSPKPDIPGYPLVGEVNDLALVRECAAHLLDETALESRKLDQGENSPQKGRKGSSTQLSAACAPGQSNTPIEVFFCYSHKDEKLRDKLEKHLSLLKREGLIAGWHDRKISAGNEWKGQIDKHLDSARIILLLVSAEFVASDYCYDIEMRRAMERHEAGDARVIPIILRPCDWHSAPFGKLQALPKDAKPVADWKSQDHAFNDIARGMRAVVKELHPSGGGKALGRTPEMTPSVEAPGLAPSPHPTAAGLGAKDAPMNSLPSAADQQSVALRAALQAPEDVLRNIAAELSDRMRLPVAVELEQTASSYRLHRLMVGNRKLFTVIQPPHGWPVRVEHQHADLSGATTWAYFGPGHDPGQPPTDQHKPIADAKALADLLVNLTASSETRAILELARRELER